ncbi:D-tyrosyl-tRNA(Tyr) deacylase [Gillisia mitskevichiae]|uniref:D-aminoacyl-tRNA deacylase n=1 Tax=Gillisia mitskevichiae TaxID=270921 RepID=A0A495Q035_9FLAO|nr:D-aminoacyl-tRNA deacylase [Gillisia mitskevichiae]RKS56138.1 D-tyrosyl-tRNA(Tyr) deacylase [Gillisia mitskevichiae]
MRIVLQRVIEASVTINENVNGQIGSGLLILVGIEDTDTKEDITWLCNKILKMRIFNDEAGVMNCSLQDIDGDVLVISQFTLHASTKKGNRPSYIKAAKPDIAIPLYEAFLLELENQLDKKVERGIFGADMKVSLINDGPVTIIIDSKSRE